jgi:hypothetical protein
MVGGLEVRDFELDVLGTIVVLRFPEGNWQDHLAQWDSRVPRDDAVEGRGALGEHVGDVELIFFKVLVKRTLSPLPP